jgi:hypothetical protein
MRYDVMVIYGTASQQLPFASNCSFQDAQALAALAERKGYTDVEIVEIIERRRGRNEPVSVPA